MVRNFETRVLLPMSVQAYTDLRMDLAFQEFSARLENQILEIKLHETDDGSIHRVVSKRFRENPVPPLLRGLASSIGATPATMAFALEERFDPNRFRAK